MGRLADTFAQLRARGQIALMPFIPAGYPDLATTAACLTELEKAGASIIEIGIPFSDPIADGPVIQEAFTQALSRKLKLADIFATIQKARAKVSIPLMAMVSYSIVYRHGVERFCDEAKEAGFDGLILPDLPLPESESVARAVQGRGLDTVFLIAPTTRPERRTEIAKLCSGFIYYLSITGITGEREKLPADLEANIRELKGLTDRPICVGFGINKPEHVAQLSGAADGAIVGSAVVRRMRDHEREGPDGIARAVGAYVRELLS
jgi:tryptophan synthase alpha chain